MKYFTISDIYLVILTYKLSINMEDETIESFFHRLELDDKVEEFKEQDIDLCLLLELNETQLAETLSKMNLTIGKQMRIRKEIEKMKSRK